MTGVLANEAAARVIPIEMPEREPRRYSRQDTIRLASIGVGIQGSGDTNTALRVPGGPGSGPVRDRSRAVRAAGRFVTGAG